MRLRCRRGGQGEAEGGQGEAEGGDAEGVLAARRVDVLPVAHRPEPNKPAKRCRELVAPYLKRPGARV